MVSWSMNTSPISRIPVLRNVEPFKLNWVGANELEPLVSAWTIKPLLNAKSPPPTVVIPFSVRVPGALTLPAVQPKVPLIAVAPFTVSEPPVTVTLPSIVDADWMVKLPLMISSKIPESIVNVLTVLVSASIVTTAPRVSINTSSPALGRAPKLQFAITSQSPARPPTQVLNNALAAPRSILAAL